MSTEHQRYAPKNQAAAIATFALAHGFEVVRSYEDLGVSGITAEARRGLQCMLADILGGEASFEAVLVYDVSRWGRFQNPDESAHYEFLCAQAGVRVIYCNEAFENDGSLSSTLLKSLRRVMAAEYSRDLSQRVSASLQRGFEDGYWVGSTPGYGFRRQVVYADGRPGPILQYREQRAIQGQRSRLVRGPIQERLIVRRIYQLCIDGVGLTAIASRLNAENIKSERGKAWTVPLVRQVLTHPKYMGDAIHGRVRRRLGQQIAIPREDWLVRPSDYPQIVTRKVFAAAQAAIAQRVYVTPPDEVLLARARELYDAHGRLTYRMLEREGAPASEATYRKRFGSIDDLQAALGHPPARRRRKHCHLSDEEALAGLAALHRKVGHLNRQLVDAAEGLPRAAIYARRFGSLSRAFALVGYVPLKPHEFRSPMAVARMAAARTAMARWRDAEKTEAPTLEDDGSG